MCGSFVVIENRHKVIYLNIIRAIYKMLEASMLWYKKFRSKLDEIGFIFNDTNQCVANRMVKTISI